MKYIPNILSCCRILLSLYLFIIPKENFIFLFIYLLCGITDFADGFIARRFNNVSSTGAKIDSLADIVFTIFILHSIYQMAPFSLKNDLSIYILSIFLLRIANMIITKIKFKQWNVMHTVGNKLTGFLLFSLLPIYFIWGQIPRVIIGVLIMIAIFSSLEESCMLLFSKYYDVNRKGLFNN